MGRLGDKVWKGATRIQRTTAAAILQAVVLGTPVGNTALWASKAPAGYSGGRARANWRVGLGGAQSGEVQKEDPAGQQTISEGISRMQQSKGGEDIHLTNNVAHIVPLNQGHSKQAPAGFVEQAVQAGEAHVAQQRILS